MIVMAGCARTDIPMQGLVEGFSSDQTKVFIAHDAVEDFMPAMTMPFNTDPETLQGVEIGDAVSFVLHVRKNRSYITDVERIPRSRLDEASETRDDNLASYVPGSDASARVLTVGDLITAIELVDQKGNRFQLPDTTARGLFVDFIYTRCPLPDFCPLLSSRFRQVQRGAPDDVMLVSVTIDPGYDTPEVLDAYAERYDAVYPRWRFATSDSSTLSALYVAAGVTVFTDTETLDHNLATVLIDRTGEVVRIWRDTDATVAEMLEEVALIE